MNATSSTQTNSTNKIGTSTHGVAKEKNDGNSFSDIMTQMKHKTNEAKGETPLSKEAAPSVKAANKEIDLSFLGEVAEKEQKEGGLRLSDLLATISHDTDVPKGTDLINFKTILSAKNDDPKLLNTDLLNLLPPEGRAKLSTELMEGVKHEVKGRLARIIPEERIPTTLKGMLETAIRFDIKVDNIKLETIEGNKAAKELLALFHLNEKNLAAAPLSKVALNKQENIIERKLSDKKAAEASPLQMILEKQKDVKSESTPKPTAVPLVPEKKIVAAADGNSATGPVKEAENESAIKKTDIVSSNTASDENKDDAIGTLSAADDAADVTLEPHEKRSESDLDEIFEKSAKTELGGEAGRRLKKRSDVRERVDLEIGKNIETKKNDSDAEFKQINMAQNDTMQKMGLEKRVDLPSMKLSSEEAKKEDRKEEIKSSAKEEKALALDAKVVKLEMPAGKEMVDNSSVDELHAANHEAVLNDEKERDEPQLAGEKNEEGSSLVKNESSHKSESGLSSRIVEGKQLISQLSSDIKEAMANYKPPFTKLTMKLRPEKLGEIDVTMVQRGNNVHINLSSNSAALSLLQQQSGDLKAALSDMGFGDTSMKFTQSDSGRQQQQQRHSTNERYQEMAKLDNNVEMLELIVPRYG